MEQAATMELAAELVRRHPALAAARPALEAAVSLVGDALAAGGTLYLCGNGGSAADCDHIAGELLKGFLLPRPLPAAAAARLAALGGEDGAYLGRKLQGGLRAVTLTGHPALSSAVINDNGGDLAFAQQLWALGRAGDVLLAISTSGNARNVRLAALAAKALGMKVVLLSGETGGQLRPLADLALCVPERETFKVQELHLPLYHTFCAMLERRFFAP
ncbi:MAG: SIS domain-containing protein [Lentisphaeria bacterium]|jgi:D-sedoheptulose 7-phosphate isomerase